MPGLRAGSIGAGNGVRKQRRIGGKPKLSGRADGPAN
jgi:hypothetical protein